MSEVDKGEYYATLVENAGEHAKAFVKWIENQPWSDIGVKLEWGEPGPFLTWRGCAKLARFSNEGKLVATRLDLSEYCRNTLKSVKIASTYWEQIGSLIPGAKQFTSEQGLPAIRDSSGKPVGFAPLWSNRERLWEIFAQACAELEALSGPKRS